MDLTVELEDRVAAQDEVFGLVVVRAGPCHVLGLGPGEQEGDVTRGQGAVDRLRGREGRALVDPAHLDQRLDTRRPQGRQACG